MATFLVHGLCGRKRPSTTGGSDACASREVPVEATGHSIAPPPGHLTGRKGEAVSNRLEELRLQEYQPVGFWRIFIQIMAYIAMIVLIAKVWRESGYVAAVVMTALALIALAVSFRHILREIVAYWQRNVRGYNLWCLRDMNGRMTLCVRPRQRRKHDQALAYSTHADAVAVVLRLGGWFGRSWIHCGGNVAGEYHTDLVRKEFKKSRFLVRDIYINTGAVIVQWYDHRGDRLTMTVDMALEWLYEYATQEHQPTMALWLWSITEHERNAWRREREGRYEAEAHWTDAVNGLIFAARAIAATTRFGRSTEARCIRRELANTALSVMSPGDPYRSEMEQLAKARVTATARA